MVHWFVRRLFVDVGFFEHKGKTQILFGEWMKTMGETKDTWWKMDFWVVLIVVFSVFWCSFLFGPIRGWVFQNLGCLRDDCDRDLKQDLIPMIGLGKSPPQFRFCFMDVTSCYVKTKTCWLNFRAMNPAIQTFRSRLHQSCKTGGFLRGFPNIALFGRMIFGPKRQGAPQDWAPSTL